PTRPPRPVTRAAAPAARRGRARTLAYCTTPRSARHAERNGSPARAPGSRTRRRSAPQARCPPAAGGLPPPTSTRPPAAGAARSGQACPGGQHGERSSNARSQFPQRDQRLERPPPASRSDDTPPKRRNIGRDGSSWINAWIRWLSRHTAAILSATERATAYGLVLAHRAVVGLLGAGAQRLGVDRSYG